MNLDDKIRLSSSNKASLELGNNAGVRSNNKMKSVSDNESIKVTKKEELTSNIYITNVKNLNPIDFWGNIAKM